MLEVAPRRYWFIRWADRLARWVITAGGLVVIGAVIGMLVLLVSVVLPLFQEAKAPLRAVCAMPVAPAGRMDAASASTDLESPVAVGVELVEIGRSGQEDLLTGYLVRRSGQLVGFELVGPPGADSQDPEAVRPQVIFQQQLRPAEGEQSGQPKQSNESAQSGQSARAAHSAEVGSDAPGVS
ncbi:MAG TPA: hypothetical protein PK777_03030, partial [Thermoguttaceae bacterium]|nr:hypothetical protein [Thermoguttaceae bacterium]